MSEIFVCAATTPSRPLPLPLSAMALPPGLQGGSPVLPCKPPYRRRGYRSVTTVLVSYGGWDATEGRPARSFPESEPRYPDPADGPSWFSTRPTAALSRGAEFDERSFTDGPPRHVHPRRRGRSRALGGHPPRPGGDRGGVRLGRAGGRRRRDRAVRHPAPR